ncbi:MAG: glycosyltransferase [Acidobacteriota bacterium]
MPLEREISVVVIGRNEGPRLARCLESVRGAEGLAECQLIYVDSASTDDSVERARSFGADVVVLEAAPFTAARGRNAGWRRAEAPLVLFLDGDTVLHPEFAAAAAREIERSGAAAVWGHRRETRTADSLYNRLLDLDWIYPPGPSPFCGGDVLFRRGVLEAVDGYDEGLIAGEEPEMCRRVRALGESILHIDVPMTGHDLAMTRFSQYWRRAERAGYAYAQVSERFKNSEDPFWLSEARRNRVHAVGLGVAGLLFVGLLIVFGRPVLWLLLLPFAVLLRTAVRCRFKSPSLPLRLLYAVHSHAQQIPILYGQWTYFRGRKEGRARTLIEYKETPS